MSLVSSTPSLVPGFDVTVHVVLDDFGAAGKVYHETDEADAGLEATAFVEFHVGKEEVLRAESGLFEYPKGLRGRRIRPVEIERDQPQKPHLPEMARYTAR